MSLETAIQEAERLRRQMDELRKSAEDFKDAALRVRSRLGSAEKRIEFGEKLMPLIKLIKDECRAFCEYGQAKITELKKEINDNE